MTDVIPAASEKGASVTAAVIGDVVIECPIKVKTEIEQSRDCLICSCHTDDQWYDLLWTETRSGHSPLVAYVCRVAEVRLTEAPNGAGGRFVCRTCVELINVLERAELEYYRLKESFVAIISENPAFERASLSGLTRQLEVELVKHEVEDVVAASRTRTKSGVRARANNSDDEPLMLRKKRGKKPTKRRKDAKDRGYNASERTSSYRVKEEDEEHIMRQRHRYPSLDLAGEDDFSADAADWTVDSLDPGNDYEPTINNKAKSKRKSRSLENDLEKRSGLRSKLQNVSIPVLGKVSSHLVIKADEDCDLKNFVETEDMVEKIKKQKKKSQPKALYPCSKCTVKLSSLSRLSFHMAKHEGKAKAPFICEICGAHYKHKKACDIHVALHKGISDWKCEECNKLFPSKGALQRHNAIHTGKPNYQCDLCGKSFIHTSSFKMHKLSHTGVKPHACDVCGLALMTRSHLKRHKRIHSGEKRHECTVCAKRFSERYNLLAHQKSHEQAPPGQPATAAPRKPWQGFRCHLCEKRFERRYMLEKHLEQVHQRILERGPPKPRNTMTKLLKAQAAAVSKTVARLDGNDQLGQQPGSAAVQSEPGASTEDTSVDVKPHITQVLEEKETEDNGAGKSSPQPVATSVSRPTEATDEAYETLRVTNGAWASSSYVASEYSMRIAEYPQ